MIIDTHVHYKTKSTIHYLSSHSGIHSPEHMILNRNAFRQNYENYCSGKEYPLKDETKTGAEIHISKFSITEEPICFPFNNRDAQTSHCSKSCSGRIDLRKRIFL